MKKIKLVTLAVLITACGMISCQKLDEKVYSQIAPSDYFSGSGDVDAALVAMYRPLQNCCGGPQQSGGFVLNTASDEGESSNPTWGQYDALTYTPGSSGDVDGIWQTSYSSINSANFVLDNADKITKLEPSVAPQKLAEAYFMRAYNYFILVQMFGGVPLRVTSLKRADQINLPRSTEDQVYAQIISDFKNAEQNLPATQDLAGKPTKYAATAFLAKVYLTTKDYTDAVSEANAVVSSGKYSLQPTFAAIFDVNNKDNSEVIFNLEYIRKDTYGMRMQELYTGPNDHDAYGGSGGWGLGNIASGMYERYPAGDSRIQTTFSNPAAGQATYYTGKWVDPQGVSADGHGTNYIIYRYADLLLELAEASNQLNGPTPAAYAPINQVRHRANLPDITPAMTQDQFTAAVINERNLELCYEEWRWFDLKRTGMLKATLTAAGRPWNDRFLLFPIPQTEIDGSNGTVKQNPGY